MITGDRQSSNMNTFYIVKSVCSLIQTVSELLSGLFFGGGLLFCEGTLSPTAVPCIYY